MSSNAYLIDAQTRHQVYLQRLAGGNVNRVLPFLEDFRDELRKQIGTGNTEIQAARLTELLRTVDGLVEGLSGSVSEQLRSDLKELAEYETGFQSRMLGESVNLDTVNPSAEQILAAVDNTPFRMLTGQTEERLTVNEMVEQFSTAQKRNVRNMIRNGVVQGRTTDEISRDIGRLVTGRSRQQAETLVRTSTNHIATVARDEVMRDNADILDGERFIATLDASTTLTCAGYDRERFDVGEGPKPPLHHGCRSTRSPIVKPQYSVTSKGGERASMDGPVDARTTYNSWLKRQPTEFQNDVLGPERAKLLREGMSVDRFTDDSGRVLSLDQLREREGLTLQ